MVDRRITRIVAVLALVAAAGCTPRPTDELSIADLIPDTGAVLVWHVRTSDCLTCTLPDYDVRRLQAVDGDRFQLVVIHIGRESDQGVPSGFLQQRRIQPARIHTIGPRQYGTLFPDRTPPLVELIADGTSIWRSKEALSQDASRTIYEHLHEVLSSLQS